MSEFDPSAKEKVIGLTGGIASGKSTVANMLRESGFPVLDFDKIAAEVRERPEVQEQLLAHFKTTDRKRLREIVFSEPIHRIFLHKLVGEPTVSEAIARTKALFAQNQQKVIWETALLVDGGLFNNMAHCILVDVPRSSRKRRLLARDGITEELAEQMLNAQATDEDRRNIILSTHKPFIIENSGSEEDLKASVQKLIEELKAL